MKDTNSVVVEKTAGGSRRWIIYAGVLLIVFLLGFLPMWLQKREADNLLTMTQKQFDKAEIKGLLTAAIVDARRGEYETARQQTSDFYTRLRTEIDKADNSVYTSGERGKFQTLLADRDATITMLAQRDQASAEKLTTTYLTYQSAIGQTTATPAASSSPTSATNQ